MDRRCMLPQGTPSLDPGGHALDRPLALLPGGRPPAPQLSSGACAPLAEPGSLAWVRLSRGRAPLPSCSLCGGKPGLGHGVDQAPISCPSPPTREGREKASRLGGSCSERWAPAPTQPHPVAFPRQRERVQQWGDQKLTNVPCMERTEGRGRGAAGEGAGSQSRLSSPLHERSCWRRGPRCSGCRDRLTSPSFLSSSGGRDKWSPGIASEPLGPLPADTWQCFLGGCLFES